MTPEWVGIHEYKLDTKHRLMLVLSLDLHGCIEVLWTQACFFHGKATNPNSCGREQEAQQLFLFFANLEQACVPVSDAGLFD